ncbi:uncharacterized protein MYCFIDRAFT_173947 [Pseudocercospora fijiensis CIRAD86]|uniref:Uncharacterized protein n=1 Tax=Pseudocercospora fijiensis (strain CIRAD86) TaxID=383855 RepID=M3B6W9_PSEFD|nr:uncharacterized protein MYCFIDRAFT_173947 [Pseudocercospora fijiensis CIRAD86]EME85082.1 hypothetical protein MYCFIDRAFT_173947 [Pseudocercospora fijiensis CIRAD86]
MLTFLSTEATEPQVATESAAACEDHKKVTRSVRSYCGRDEPGTLQLLVCYDTVTSNLPRSSKTPLRRCQPLDLTPIGRHTAKRKRVLRRHCNLPESPSPSMSCPKLEHFSHHLGPPGSNDRRLDLESRMKKTIGQSSSDKWVSPNKFAGFIQTSRKDSPKSERKPYGATMLIPTRILTPRSSTDVAPDHHSTIISANNMAMDTAPNNRVVGIVAAGIVVFLLIAALVGWYIYFQRRQHRAVRESLVELRAPVWSPRPDSSIRPPYQSASSQDRTFGSAFQTC